MILLLRLRRAKGLLLILSNSLSRWGTPASAAAVPVASAPAPHTAPGGLRLGACHLVGYEPPTSATATGLYRCLRVQLSAEQGFHGILDLTGHPAIDGDPLGPQRFDRPTVDPATNHRIHAQFEQLVDSLVRSPIGCCELLTL